ncbi:hypothetical protein [Oceaniglobus trochenteri]|uniref:aldose epimerase family protein n=1 Tax=Oceaniglobus trochenteri TaxID=2763260 RepID=UPI001CFFBA85
MKISCGDLAAILAPDWGGRMLRLIHASAGDLLYPCAAESFDRLRWPKGGGYPLFPYHGRMGNAAFPWDGGQARLAAHPDAAPHSLHGPAHRTPWEVDDHGTDRATLRCLYAADEDWPWSFEARQVFRLDETGLSVTLEIINRDHRDMPAGVGWHPYFPRAETIVSDARWQWPHDDDGLPTGERHRPGPLQAATSSLSGWGYVDLALSGGAKLRITAPVGMDHLVIHDNPRGYTCVEPVSHLTNAPNMDAAPQMARLAPGASLSGEVRLTLLPG